MTCTALWYCPHVTLQLFCLLSHVTFISTPVCHSPSLSSLFTCPCLYNIPGCSGDSVSLFCTMKVFPVLVMLSSAVQLCSTAPALEPLTCSEDIGAMVAARLAMHHINEHHDHGYKFRLNEIQGNKVEKVREPDFSSKYTHFQEKCLKCFIFFNDKIKNCHS